MRSPWRQRIVLLLAAAALLGPAARSIPAQAAQGSVLWKPVAMGIVKLNDEAPKSWNMYYTEKRGWILLRLWKRYLLVGIKDQEVYDLDPQSVTPKGETLLWSNPEFPENPLTISGWNERDVGPVRRIRFRLGKDGHILELQLPLRLNGRPMY